MSEPNKILIVHDGFDGQHIHNNLLARGIDPTLITRVMNFDQLRSLTSINSLGLVVMHKDFQGEKGCEEAVRLLERKCGHDRYELPSIIAISSGEAIRSGVSFTAVRAGADFLFNPRIDQAIPDRVIQAYESGAIGVRGHTRGETIINLAYYSGGTLERGTDGSGIEIM